jgi:flavin-binding protein dodecin
MAIDNKPALAAAAQKALSRLAQNCPGLKWATVATKDGAESPATAAAPTRSSA